MAMETLVIEWAEGFHPWTLILLSVFTLLFLPQLNRFWSKKLKLPPSPPKLPIIGNLHQLGKLVHRSCRDLSDKYGPLMLLHFGSKPTVIVSSGEIAKEFMNTHDIAFANKSFTTAAKIFTYGFTDVVFSPYGDYWRHVRKIVVVDLLSIKRVQSFKYVRDEEVTTVVDEIYHFSSAGTPVDLTKMINSLTYNIICRCALGNTLEKNGKTGELPRELLKIMVAFSFRDLFPWLGWLDRFTGFDKRVKKASNELDIFFDQIIDEHIAEYKDGHQKDFVDQLLHAQKNSISNINFSRENMKAVIMDMFVAGVETNSTTIEWAMAELMKKPKLMTKVQEEVRRVVGKKTKVDEDDINHMEFLKAAIKETLRLHPPTPLLSARESYTSKTINNYDIPPYTRVMINIWAIQRDPNQWENAEEFIPERFIENTTDFKGIHFNFIPFGAGRRICPGMTFGVAMIESALANLLHWFDWELPGNAKREELDMTESFSLSVPKRIPLSLVPISHFSKSA